MSTRRSLSGARRRGLLARRAEVRLFCKANFPSPPVELREDGVPVVELASFPSFASSFSSLGVFPVEGGSDFCSRPFFTGFVDCFPVAFGSAGVAVAVSSCSFFSS